MELVLDRHRLWGVVIDCNCKGGNISNNPIRNPLQSRISLIRDNWCQKWIYSLSPNFIFIFDLILISSFVPSKSTLSLYYLSPLHSLFHLLHNTQVCASALCCPAMYIIYFPSQHHERKERERLSARNQTRAVLGRLYCEFLSRSAQIVSRRTWWEHHDRSGTTFTILCS
jgi:hypothetical protein